LDYGRVLQNVRSRGSKSGRQAKRWAILPGPALKANMGGAACLLLGIIAIAGCGSSSKSEPVDTAFVTSANAACQTAFAESEAFKRPAGPRGFPAYAAHLDPIAKGLLVRLSALTPPPGKRAQYAKLLALWHQEALLAVARSEAIKAGDERRSRGVNEEGHNVDAQFDSAATELGLTECARKL
jgi:hypothetical protein